MSAIGTLRLSLTWLHTCAGLAFGWLLFTIFLTGAIAVFNDEITAWMMPELGGVGDPHAAVSIAERRLRTNAVGAESWTITPPSSRQSFVQIEWASPRGPRGREVLDLATGIPVTPRDTQGGLFFHRFHYRFQTYGCCRGFWFSGAAAIALLVSLISGLVIHRRLMKDFFVLRLKAGVQTAWLDVHKRLGVLALPFHLMIAYTGLMPMVSVIMFAPVIAQYRGERSALAAFEDYDPILSKFLQDRRVPSLVGSPILEPGSVVALDRVAAAARSVWNGGTVGRIAVTDIGSGRALIEVTRSVEDHVSNAQERLFFDASTGQLIQAFREERPVLKLFSTLYGLHIARFASVIVRWMYFLLGIASTVLIATGLIYWTIKRRGAVKSPSSQRWYRVVEGVNAGVIMGLPIAIASFFWANRLLPVDGVDRATKEMYSFFAVWCVAILMLSIIRPVRAWRAGLTVGAIAYAGIPLINALTTNRSFVASRDTLVVTFDLTMVVIAALFALASRKVAAANASATAEPPAGF